LYRHKNVNSEQAREHTGQPRYMEVHHHSRHHEKRKWNHYFWEFFMLFLAVFCGMLAEYQLEHYIEHQREKKYIRSLVRDTELDLASLRSAFNGRVQQIKYFDSLMLLLQSGVNNRNSEIYYYARHITRPAVFRYHDRTIQQLKNSGNLRLIRNQDAADSITVYDNEKIKSLLVQQEGETDQRRFISNFLAGKIFDPFAWHSMTDSSGTIRRLADNPAIMTTDPSILNEFTFKVVTLRGTLAFTNRMITETMHSATNLLEMLKKEYHLE